MKICICGPVNPFELREFISSEESVIELNKGASAVNTYVKELLRNGHEVVIVTSDVPLNISQDLTYYGEKLTIHILQSKPGIFLYHGFSRFYMVSRLKKYLKKIAPLVDVVHCQWTYDYTMAARSIEDIVPVFCTVRDWCPYIKQVQSSFFKRIQWNLYYLQFKYVMNSKKITFIANSEYTKDCILSSYPEKKVSIIYNPIDKNLILAKKKKKIDNPTFISIASSATEKRKNIPKLLEAFSSFLTISPNAKLLLVGNGFCEDNPELKVFAAKGLLKNVELLGRKTHMEVIAAIDDSTCLIHPALEETFGNILLEGMARCVCVIGGDKSGAVPLVLNKGKCGILCDVTSVASMVDAMKKALNLKETQSLIEEGTSRLLGSYSSDVILEKHLQLYKNKRI